MVFLPNSQNKFVPMKEMISKLKLEEIKRELEQKRKKDYTIKIPRFELETQTDLIPIFKELGIKEAFEWQKADFTKMFAVKKGDVRIGKIVHKSYLKIDEEGGEAAGATAIVMQLKCMPERPNYFIADHPFVFYIVDNKYNSIIFIGQLVKPEVKNSDKK
jgi:serpin B